jgi:hypothetical protein
MGFRGEGGASFKYGLDEMNEKRGKVVCKLRTNCPEFKNGKILLSGRDRQTYTYGTILFSI